MGGAARVAFDLDFSSRSNPEDDRLLAESLRRAAARVVLPVIEQNWDGGDGARLTTAPLPQFQQHARLASVNVVPAADGLVRQFPTRHSSDGLNIPSMPAALSGRLGSSVELVHVDYGIRPRSVPTLSYSDILFRRVDPSVVAGRTVIVGATALELGDIIATPVYRSLPGAVVQALAYETLIQDRTIRRVHAIPVIIVTILLAASVSAAAARRTWDRGVMLAAR